MVAKAPMSIESVLQFCRLALSIHDRRLVAGLKVTKLRCIVSVRIGQAAMLALASNSDKADLLAGFVDWVSSATREELLDLFPG